MTAAWDPLKAAANYRKHGVRFSDAQVVPYDPASIILDEAEPAARKGRSMKKEYDFSKGRRGPLLSSEGKTRITIYIDNDVLDAFRDRSDVEGRGYQTMVNEALREYLGRSRPPLDARTLRRILREEFKRAS